jgi:hypothetical protein
MKVFRSLLFLALCPAFANADTDVTECHYLWTTDCFEIRDSLSRDITHHVLLSGKQFRFSLSGTQQCDASALDSHLTKQQQAQVLKLFNRRLKKLSGCKQLDSLTPRFFTDEGEIQKEWQRLAGERSFKSLHLIEKLPD